MSTSKLVRVLRHIKERGPVLENLDASRALGMNTNALSQAKGRLLAKDCIRLLGHRSHVVLTQYGEDVLAGLTPPPRWKSDKPRPGAKASGSSPSKPPASHKGKAARRTCRLCLKKFPSEGPGNRICKRCHNSPEWKSPAACGYVRQEV